MAKIIPDGFRAQVDFFKVRAPQWRQRAEQIGLSDAQAQSLEQLTDEAVAAREVMELARVAAENATQSFYTATRKMTKQGRDLVKVIDVHARLTQDDDVYTDASLPVPDTSHHDRPAPPRPKSVSAAMLSDGSVRLTWKPPLRSQGDWRGRTYFIIERRVMTANGDHSSALTMIGTSGERRFIDTTVPPGTTEAFYQVRATRNGKLSPVVNTVLQLHGTPKRTGHPASNRAA